MLFLFLFQNKMTIKIIIADDGLGFEPSKSKNGFGMKTMRDRAEELSGTLTIESEQGVGTAIAVSIPISEENDDYDNNRR